MNHGIKDTGINVHGKLLYACNVILQIYSKQHKEQKTIMHKLIPKDVGFRKMVSL